MNKLENLLWIDLEMTGLDARKDVILEIAALATDKDLNLLADGPELVIHQPESALALMDKWVADHHAKSGLTAAVQASQVSTAQAEEQVLAFAEQYGVKGKMMLCGNSIWQDRAFIQQHMPKLYAFLHYRMVDVTSIKELVLRWYPNSPYKEFKKTDTHRALVDIKESVAELEHYRKYFFVPSL